MRVGVSTRLLWDVEKSMALNLDFINKFAQVAEIWVMPPFFPSWRGSGMKGDLDRLKDALSVYELRTSIHSPHHDLNFASINPACASTALKEVEKCIGVAEFLGSDVLTFHPGYYRYWRNRGFAALEHNLIRLNEKGSDSGCILCMENMVGGSSYCTQSKEILELIEGLEHIYLTLDIAHALVQDEPVDSFIEAVGPKIRHAHISDLKNKKHVHLPIGDGDLEFGKALSCLKGAGFAGSFIIEGVPDNPHVRIPEEVQALRKMLEEAGY